MSQGFTKGIPIDTDPTMALNSNQVVPSQAAVVSYVGTKTCQTLTGNSGGSLLPSVGNFNILGSGSITTTGSGSTITISTSGNGIGWVDNSGTFTAVVNTGYFLTAASTPTLPASPTTGDVCEFVVIAAATMTITGNTGQVIRLGSTASASAGTCVSAIIGNTIRLVYRDTGTTWWADASVGSWNIT
jgi:hypothetical protein